MCSKHMSATWYNSTIGLSGDLVHGRYERDIDLWVSKVEDGRVSTCTMQPECSWRGVRNGIWFTGTLLDRLFTKDAAGCKAVCCFLSFDCEAYSWSRSDRTMNFSGGGLCILRKDVHETDLQTTSDDDSCAVHEGSFNYYTECNEQSNRTVNY